MSGLYVLSKFYFRDDEKDKARETLEKVGVSCEGETRFLLACVELLYEYGQLEIASEFLRRFPAGTLETNEYKIAKFIAESKGKSPSDLMNEGLELYNSDAKNINAFKILITAMKQTEFSDKADEILEEAKDVWPGQDLKFAA